LLRLHSVGQSRPRDYPPARCPVNTFTIDGDKFVFDTGVAITTTVTSLVLEFSTPLTGAGGQVMLIPGTEERPGSGVTAGNGAVFFPITGTLQTPEPGTAKLLLLALPAIGLARRRRGGESALNWHTKKAGC
jgi:hypothetical protein